MTTGFKLFCFGLGYSALALAERVLASGGEVSGACRGEEKQAALIARGIEAIRWGEALPPGLTHLLISIPPGERGDPVLTSYAEAMAAPPHLRWVGYLSTTGVYGDHQGGWVDEKTPVNPPNERLRRRVQAEDGWLSLCQRESLPVHLFRLAGIYGPGRSAVDDVREGTARRIDKPGQFFSRIHVADIAQVLLASMERPSPGDIYNVCDDEPAPSHEVVTYACRLLGVEPPPLIPFAQSELSPMARSFYDANRRVRNDRIKRELGVRLLYPTYREGLEAIFTCCGGFHSTVS